MIVAAGATIRRFRQSLREAAPQHRRSLMRAIRILLLLVLASTIAGVVVSDASALGFEDNPCPPIDPDNPQLKVCPDAGVGKPYSLQVLGNGGCTPDSVTYDVT